MSATFAFYKGKTRLTDRIIQAATRSSYSHIEILEAAPINGAAFCIAASKRDGETVRVKRIYFEPDRWDFVTVRHLDAGRVWSQAITFLGTPYNAFGALLTVTPFHYRPLHLHKVFCSELTALVCDLPNPHRWTPGAFYQWAVFLEAEPALV